MTTNGTTVDYHALLGVELTATAEEIRDAYQGLMMEYHPDKLGRELTAAEVAKVTELTIAHGALLRTTQRRATSR